jgi:hypothetical protein
MIAFGKLQIQLVLVDFVLHILQNQNANMLVLKILDLLLYVNGKMDYVLQQLMFNQELKVIVLQVLVDHLDGLIMLV